MCDSWSRCKTPNGLKTYYKCTTEQLFYIIGFDPCGFHVRRCAHTICTLDRVEEQIIPT
jgi:hypothetical protein